MDALIITTLALVATETLLGIAIIALGIYQRI